MLIFTDNHSENESYVWPDPGALVERWRYMTIQECRETLRCETSDFDPRTPLRHGFEQSLSNFDRDAQASLSNLIALSSSDLEIISRIARRAATVWLEFAAHRCRITISLIGDESVDQRAKVDDFMHGPSQLTVVPVVGRYGNDLGTDLESYQVIDRCAGEGLTVGM